MTARAREDHLHLLLRQLADDDSNVVNRAMQQLGELGRPALPHLRRLVVLGEQPIARRAAMALGLMIGPTAAPAASELIATLATWEDIDRIHALNTLAKIGSHAPETIPFLLARLRDDEANLSHGAAFILADIATPNEVTIHALVSSIQAAARKTPRTHSRHCFIEALGMLCGRAPSHVSLEPAFAVLLPILSEPPLEAPLWDPRKLFLKFERYMSISEAMRALARLGPPGRVAIPSAMALRSDPSLGDLAKSFLELFSDST